MKLLFECTNADSISMTKNQTLQAYPSFVIHYLEVVAYIYIQLYIYISTKLLITPVATLFVDVSNGGEDVMSCRHS